MNFRKILILFIFTLILLFMFKAFAANNNSQTTSSSKNKVQKTKFAKTEFNLLTKGINDYDDLLYRNEESRINLELNTLDKIFADNISIVLLEKIEGYNTIKNYIEDFIYFNHDNPYISGVLIFIIKNDNYILLTSTSPENTTYKGILTYQKEIISCIKDGNKKNTIADGISNALLFLIQKFNIKNIPLPLKHEYLKYSYDDEGSTVNTKFTPFIFIHNVTAGIISIITFIFSLFLVIFKRWFAAKNNLYINTPKIPLMAVDLLYFSLFAYIISSIAFMFFIKYNHIIFRIIFLLFMLLISNMVIGYIAEGKKWARKVLIIFVFVGLVIVLPGFIRIFKLIPIGLIIFFLIRWSIDVVCELLFAAKALNMNNKIRVNINKIKILRKFIILFSCSINH